MKAIGVMNGVRRHWTESSGPVLPSYRSTLATKIDEARKYFAHTGRGNATLAELEKQFAETYGLLKFIIQFDWFTATEL